MINNNSSQLNNINSSRDVAGRDISNTENNITNITIIGLQETEIHNIIDIKVDKLKNELKESTEIINKILEKNIKKISKKLNKKYSIDSLGSFKTYLKLIETYSEKPETKFAEILCDILASSLPTDNNSILRSSLNEAIDTARLLNADQMRLLAFMFLIRNTIFDSINTWGDIEIFIKEILWKFAPDGLSSQILPKHLEYSKCTTFVAREMLISRMLTNSYLPAISNSLGSSSTRDEILSSYSECKNSNAIPESSRLSRQIFDIFSLNKSYAPNIDNNGHYATRKGNDENKEIERKILDLIKSCPQGEKIYVEWATSPIKNHVLTPVGMIIAISVMRNEFGLDFDYSRWIY